MKVRIIPVYQYENCVVMANPAMDKKGDRCVHALGLSSGFSQDIYESEYNWMVVGLPRHEAARAYFEKHPKGDKDE